ncbi:junctional sarcoplasmic reticulum protein 1 isoform X2 [Cavia porcellus]|uniref:junctional sarcoplasmic reticulum protein 1 isoform X2 n=1 Tax=Cavia porcellus TaxID=10141 RepID=UPI002FE2CAC5
MWAQLLQVPGTTMPHCSGRDLAPVSMTARALEELDRGLGSCLANECSELAGTGTGQVKEDEAREAPRLAETSSWPQGPHEDARPKKMEKEPAARGTLGPGKEKQKPGATPRSAPARKKPQAAPPAQPPPPPPAPSEELPWGDLTVNKCLVLASLVALLGSAVQLCRDAVAGQEAAPVPWVPPTAPPKHPVPPVPKLTAPSKPPAPQVGPPAPQVEAGDKPEVPGSRETAEKVQRDPGEAANRGERATRAEQGPREKSRKEEKPRRERPRRAEKPWKEKPRKEHRPRKERPRAAGEPREALPRRWGTPEGGHRLWARDTGDPEHRKRQAWASPRRPEADRPPGRQQHRQGKGRD